MLMLMGLNIYYFGYVTKKLERNGNSVNPLYLMIKDELTDISF